MEVFEGGLGKGWVDDRSLWGRQTTWSETAVTLESVSPQGIPVPRSLVKPVAIKAMLPF